MECLIHKPLKDDMEKFYIYNPSITHIIDENIKRIQLSA